MKTCNRCKVDKPGSEYHQDTRKADGLNTRCKSCRAPSIHVGNAKRRQKQVDAAGRAPVNCEVCKIKLEPGRNPNSACWDHNHETGQFRGWLCSGCNRALGCARDNPTILLNLAKYLLERGHET